jgi:hypothetical protein
MMDKQLFTSIGFSLLGMMLFPFFSLGSNSIVKAKGSAQIRVERNMTREEAERKVIELARINAVESVFGAYIEQQSQLTVENGRADFYLMGSTKTRGIWVRDLKKNIFEEFRDEQTANGKEKMLWLTCIIEGEVKQMKPRPDIEFQIRKCELPQCNSNKFKSGERLYVWFKSPVDGYFSLFISEGDSISRLLPYLKNEDSNAVKVVHDQEYLFFGNQKPGYGFDQEGIKLVTTQKREINHIYMVFSTIEFVKPGLKKGVNPIILPMLHKVRFEEWLADNRARCDDFFDILVPLEIYME